MNDEYDSSDFCENIFDKYSKRPTDLENICLAEYATEYENVKTKNNLNDSDTNSDDDDDLDVQLNCIESHNKANRKTYKLLNSNLSIRKRIKSAVLKIPYLSIIEDETEYYYSLLVLYFPFRIESSILNGFTNSKQAFLSKSLQIQQMNNNNNCLILIKKQIELQQAIDRINLLELIEEPEEPALLNVQNSNEDLYENELEQNDNEQVRVPIDNITLANRISQLNTEQNLILNKVKTRLSSKDNDPLSIIIHGPGGVGKSFLAHVIIDLVNNTLDTDHLIQKLNVVVAAPTGVAAKAIGGRTLHNAFNLVIEKDGLPKYEPLKGKSIFNYHYK